ncbi:hypothetical protein AB0I16_34720 [Streptomyces sp. NPDC050703]
MADEPTLGEVVRRFEDRFTDVRDDMRAAKHGADGEPTPQAALDATRRQY